MSDFFSSFLRSPRAGRHILAASAALGLMAQLWGCASAGTQARSPLDPTDLKSVEYRLAQVATFEDHYYGQTGAYTDQIPSELRVDGGLITFVILAVTKDYLVVSRTQTSTVVCRFHGGVDGDQQTVCATNDATNPTITVANPYLGAGKSR